MIHKTGRNLRLIQKSDPEILMDCPVTGEQAKELKKRELLS